MRAAIRIAMLIALVAGCASKFPVANLPQAQSFDGLYVGSVRLKNSAVTVPKAWCETSSNFSLQVRNNSFNYTMPHPNVPEIQNRPYTGAIDPDGSLRAQSGDLGVMVGRVTGSHLEGEIQGSGCDYVFTADRS